MINRRTLFARLTAVALAPLAKWLPKEEVVIGSDVAAGDGSVALYTFPNPPGMCYVTKDGTYWVSENGAHRVFCSPVPQEEA